MPSLAGVFADCAHGGAGLDGSPQGSLQGGAAREGHVASLPPFTPKAVHTVLPNMTRALGFTGVGELRPQISLSLRLSFPLSLPPSLSLSLAPGGPQPSPLPRR